VLKGLIKMAEKSIDIISCIQCSYCFISVQDNCSIRRGENDPFPSSLVFIDLAKMACMYVITAIIKVQVEK
jgi:hypothetical protein